MPPTITTDLLATILKDPDLVLLDATYFLPNENKNAKASLAAAHIPRAQFFDVDEISDHANPLPHTIPTPENFASAAGALGAGNDSRIVVYDQRGIFSAARAWWMFRVFGHQNVAVLDGGLPKWIGENRAVTSQITKITPKTFTPAFQTHMVKHAADLLENLTAKTALVLDARSTGRFNGSVPEPRPGMRSGHIPGAHSLPYTDLLNNGALRPPDELRRIFNAAGAARNRPVITSCGSGITAAVINLAALTAGLPEPALYDGSWAEWGGNPNFPVEV